MILQKPSNGLQVLAKRCDLQFSKGGKADDDFRRVEGLRDHIHNLRLTLGVTTHQRTMNGSLEVSKPPSSAATQVILGHLCQDLPSMYKLVLVEQRNETTKPGI